MSFFMAIMAVDPEADWTKVAPYDTQWSSDAATHELSFTGSAPTTGTKGAITSTFNSLVLNPSNLALNQYAGLKLTFDAYVSGTLGDVTSVIFGWNSANAKGCHIQIDKDKIQVVGIAGSTTTTLISDVNYPAIVNQNAYNSFEINVASDGFSFTVKINNYICPTTLTNGINANAIGRLIAGITPTAFCSTFTPLKIKNIVASRLGITKEYYTYTSPIAMHGDWWPQIGQNTTPPAINGWYNNGANSSLNFEGSIVSGTRIATTFGSIGAPYTGLNLKFDATIDPSGNNTMIILGSDANWGGQGIILNISKYQVQALKNFDYGNTTMLSSDVSTYQSLLAGGGVRSCEINVSGTGLITVKIAGYTCPTTYQADLTVLANSFVMVCPNVTGFVMRNVIAKKGAVAKSYFPNYAYAIAASANDGAKGSVSGTGTYDKTSDVTLTATATTGNRFINWTEGATVVGTDASLQISSIAAAHTYVANFEAAEVALSSNTNIADIANTPNADLILNGGTLNVNSGKTVKSLKANPGSKMVVDNPLAVTGDLTLVANKTTTPNVKVNSAITVTGNLKLEKTFDNTKWYYVSFPTNVAVDNIVKVSGSGTMTLGTNWWIKSYNGGLRAQNGVGSNWENVLAGGTLTANKGYVIGLANSLTGDYVLSFTLDKTLITAADVQRNVAVFANTGAAPVNNHGWNFIGQPFLSPYIGSSTSGTFNFYVTNGSGGYTAFDQANVPDINPFSSYFVQANAPLVSTGINFAIGGRQTIKSVSTTTQSARIQLNVSNASGDDYALLKLDNDKTNDYEIGYDLEKWITTDATNPQIYTRLNNLDYAFNALPESAVSNLSLGIYTKNAGMQTISMTPNQTASISGLLLTDNELGVTTNLMESDYSYNASTGTNNTRFTLGIQKVVSVVNNPTQIGKAKLSVINGNIALTNLCKGAVVCVFDASGRLVVKKIAQAASVSVDLKSKGIYCVQLTNGGISQTVKVIL